MSWGKRRRSTWADLGLGPAPQRPIIDLTSDDVIDLTLSSDDEDNELMQRSPQHSRRSQRSQHSRQSQRSRQSLRSIRRQARSRQSGSSLASLGSVRSVGSLASLGSLGSLASLPSGPPLVLQAVPEEVQSDGLQRYSWSKQGGLDAWQRLTNFKKCLGKDFLQLSSSTRFGQDAVDGAVGRGGAGVPGHLTPDSVKKVLQHMHTAHAFNRSSALLDLGCNVGWFLMGAVAFGVADVRGYDLCKTGTEIWHALLPQLQRNAAALNLRFRQWVQHLPHGLPPDADPRSPLLDGVTHAYAFWAGWTPADKRNALQVLLRLPSMRCLALVDQWHTTSEASGANIQKWLRRAAPAAGKRLREWPRFNVKQSGGGEQYTCHVYTLE